jgi:hypothetical protein
VIVTAARVRRATTLVLQRDLPAVLDRIGVQDRGSGFPPVSTWHRLADFALISDMQSPACVVTTPGIVGDPVRMRGVLRATWAVRVFVVVRGRTYEETADAVAAYVAAVRSVLLAHPALEGLASGCHWSAEAYGELDVDKARTIGAGSVTVRYLHVPTETLDLAAADGSAAPTVLTTHAEAIALEGM